MVLADRDQEPWENNTGFNACFNCIEKRGTLLIIRIIPEYFLCFKGAACLQVKSLRPSENIGVGISKIQAYTGSSTRIGSFLFNSSILQSSCPVKAESLVGIGLKRMMVLLKTPSSEALERVLLMSVCLNGSPGFINIDWMIVLG